MADKDKKRTKQWSADLIEDYKRANAEIKELMIAQLGEPRL